MNHQLKCTVGVSAGIEDAKPLTMDLDDYKSTITVMEKICKGDPLCHSLTESYKQQFNSSGLNECFDLDENATMEEDFIDHAQRDLPYVNLHRLAGVTFQVCID